MLYLFGQQIIERFYKEYVEIRISNYAYLKYLYNAIN